MPAFLSDAWIEALDVRLGSAEDGSAPSALVIQYIVVLDDDTKVEYHLELGPDGDRAHRGRSAKPIDVTFRMDRDTAHRISTGKLSTQEAFITGKLDLEGDPTSLIDAYRASDDA